MERDCRSSHAYRPEVGTDCGPRRCHGVLLFRVPCHLRAAWLSRFSLALRGCCHRMRRCHCCAVAHKSYEALSVRGSYGDAYSLANSELPALAATLTPATPVARLARFHIVDGLKVWALTGT